MLAFGKHFGHNLISGQLGILCYVWGQQHILDLIREVEVSKYLLALVQKASISVIIAVTFATLISFQD